ncbi:MAG TPA: ferritin-like domain-containing protein [Polyangiaceae bacterium]|nr:ferritin-like domain-containing protein [Polyangiaceae bacterium]
MKEDRSTSWWLATLRRRAERQQEESLDLTAPVQWSSAAEQMAAVRFFNAAFRAEESGLRQAHELADELRRVDPELSEVLRLYGNEEGWHRELLTQFLSYIGGDVRPMGRVTRTLYWLYGRARRMETIVLTNLMFEIIGSTTYRMALRNVSQPQTRRMLTILTRDEAFHVPLNVHFLKRVLQARPQASRLRLKLVYHLLFVSLLALPLASRPKAFAFDKISRLDLMRGYARMLGGLFTHDATLGLQPPRWALAALGIRAEELRVSAGLTGVEAAERAADREVVSVTAL